MSLSKRISGANITSLMVLIPHGQNALIQAKMFKEAVDFSGIILTKLDRTAKGGIAIAIASGCYTSMVYSIGEGINDLQNLIIRFVEAIFA